MNILEATKLKALRDGVCVDHELLTSKDHNAVLNIFCDLTGIVTNNKAIYQPIGE